MSAPETAIVTVRVDAGLKTRLEALARSTPQGKVVVAEKSGHFIQMDQPQLVVDAIRDVVNRARGKAMVVRMARIAVATINSIRVKPEVFWREPSRFTLADRIKKLIVTILSRSRVLLHVHGRLRWRNLNCLHAGVARSAPCDRDRRLPSCFGDERQSHHG